MPRPDEDVNVSIQLQQEIKKTAEALRKDAIRIQDEMYFDALTKAQGLRNSQKQAQAVAESRQRFMKSEGDHEITLLQDVVRTANKHINQDSTSVYTAITYQLEYTRLIMEGYAALGYLFRIQSSEPKPIIAQEITKIVKEQVRHLRTRFGSDRTDVKLPEISYAITCESGKLEVTLTEPKTDNIHDPQRKNVIEKQSESMQQHFNSLVHLWLKKNGCEERLDAAGDRTGVYTKGESILDTDEFNALKNGDNGLEKFLQDFPAFKFVDESPSVNTPRPS